MTYVLRALDKEGNQMFYTGKTGMDWLSFYQYEAFKFGKEAALRKATLFNKMERMHGYWFIAQNLEHTVDV
jgi:hypothetical protein